MSMNASEIGSKDWWTVIQTMPHIEALSHLNGYRAALVQETAGTPAYIAATAQLIRVNAEIKRINMVLSRNQWSEACRNVLTPELFEAVSTERRRLTDEAEGMDWREVV